MIRWLFFLCLFFLFWTIVHSLFLPFLFLPQNSQQNRLIIAAGIIGDPAPQTALITLLKSVFNLGQVDFGSGDENADELVIGSAHAFHGPLQRRGEKRGAVFDTADDRQHGLLQVAGHFGFDRVLDVLVT